MSDEANIVGGDSVYSYEQIDAAIGVITETSHDGTVVSRLIHVYGGKHNTKRCCEALNQSSKVSIDMEYALVIQNNLSDQGALMCAESDAEQHLSAAIKEAKQ